MLSKDDVSHLLQIMLDGGADFCDVYYEESGYNRVTSDDHKINTSRSLQSGVGLRVVKDFNTYYTVCQDASLKELTKAAKYLASGLSVASATPRAPVVIRFGERANPLSESTEEPEGVDVVKKTDLVRSAQDSAWGHSDLIKQVTVRYSDFYRDIQIGSSETSEITEQRLALVEFMIVVYAGNGSERQMGWSGKSFYRGLEALAGENAPERLAEAACKQAHTMLEADECPRGEIPVVFAPGENGVLFHESCGHGMEADLVEKGSAFADLVGEVVASEKVTIHDDGTIPGYPGSYAFDDEGIRSQDTLLIDRGRLTGYMHSLVTAKKFGVEPTGSGRRQNFKYPPVPRMRNTFIVAGDDDPAEIIRSTKKGIYAADVGFGGQVDVVTGRFITSILLGYMIEDGKLTRPVKGATITGTGIQALKDIDMVGNDFILSHSPGRCGKGQEVPVGVGMPTLRVKKLTVGGTGSSF